MLLACLLLFAPGAALAEEPELLLRASDSGGARLDLALLGGAETWPGADTTRGLSDLRLGGALSHRAPRTRGGLLYGGELTGWTDGGLLDSHILEAELLGPGVFGGAAMGQGSARLGWGELALGPSLAPAAGPDWLRVRLAGGVRSSSEVTAPLALASLTAAQRMGSVELGGRVDTRVFIEQTLPLLLIDADLALRWSATPSLRVGAALGASVTPSDDPARGWVAGVPPSGALLRAQISGERSLPRGLALRAELGLNSAPGDWLQVSALGGVRWTPSRRAPSSETRLDRGTLTLRHRAPQAQSVEVAGSFNGWSPQPMSRRDGLWQLELPLAPGRYEFTYLVDGQPTPPTACGLLLSDGFGGESCVVVVP